MASGGAVGWKAVRRYHPQAVVSDNPELGPSSTVQAHAASASSSVQWDNTGTPQGCSDALKQYM